MSATQSLWNSFRQSGYYKPAIIIAGILVFIGFMDQLIMPLYVRHWSEVELPDVVEMNIDEATRKLEDGGFQAVVADSVYNANYASGIVVEQSPAPLSTVKKGRHIYLTVSIGEKPIIMPNLFYKSPREAELILQSYGLSFSGKYYEYSDISPEGVVIAQSYPQGQVVKAGTKISITISLGAMPRQRSIPELTGKSLDEAKKHLQLLGVFQIEVEYEIREDMLPETVLRQSLPAGAPIADGLSVVLTVSKISSEGD